MVKKLYLFCSAGMSSSILADKMQKIANERNLEIEVKYYPESKFDEKAAEADLLLLSPQIRYRQAELQKKNMPLYLIEMADYGMLKAEIILNKSLESLKK
jgi:PTS system cellobiose-specific IIB component